MAVELQEASGHLPAKRKETVECVPSSPEKASRTPDGPVADCVLAMGHTAGVQEEAANELTLLHFNDVYEVQSRVREPIGGVARFIEKLRQYPDAVTLFSGDALAPSLLSTVTKGEHMVKFLNMMNISAACMGNHDFDFGVEHLRDWCVPNSNFPWLLSNAWHTDSGELLAGGRRSLVIEHRGRRLGLMGLIEEEWLATLATIERDEVPPSVPLSVRIPAKRLMGGTTLQILCEQAPAGRSTFGPVWRKGWTCAVQRRQAGCLA